MILVHLSINKKSALIDEGNIMFAEECDDKDRDGNVISFTRIYFKQPLPGENGSTEVDVCENVKSLIAKIRS